MGFFIWRALIVVGLLFMAVAHLSAGQIFYRIAQRSFEMTSIGGGYFFLAISGFFVLSTGLYLYGGWRAVFSKKL